MGRMKNRDQDSSSAGSGPSSMDDAFAGKGRLKTDQEPQEVESDSSMDELFAAAPGARSRADHDAGAAEGSLDDMFAPVVQKKRAPSPYDPPVDSKSGSDMDDLMGVAPSAAPNPRGGPGRPDGSGMDSMFGKKKISATPDPPPKKKRSSALDDLF